jgi:hypothetical protein
MLCTLAVTRKYSSLKSMGLQNMRERHKIISKFYRLKMADELRIFLEAIPIRNVRESHIGDSIYIANGEMKVGESYYPAGIRVWFRTSTDIVAQVDVPQVSISVYGDPFDPFGTAELVRLATTRAVS